MNYTEFIDSKKHTGVDSGINTIIENSNMFDYQQHVANYAIKKGRCGVFLDTGLGKTLIELHIADQYMRSTNKPVLIMTPLAVAFQFI